MYNEISIGRHPIVKFNLEVWSEIRPLVCATNLLDIPMYYHPWIHTLKLLHKLWVAVHKSEHIIPCRKMCSDSMAGSWRKSGERRSWKLCRHVEYAYYFISSIWLICWPSIQYIKASGWECREVFVLIVLSQRKRLEGLVLKDGQTPRQSSCGIIH